MLSDMSYFASEKGLSELTSSTDHERFYNKWEKIISSGMQEDHRQLNPMATRILPKEDAGLKSVDRLMKGLSDLVRLPKQSEEVMNFRTV